MEPQVLGQNLGSVQNFKVESYAMETKDNQ